jgi:hypothetical protein
MKSTLTAIALCTILATGATTSANALCGTCNTCNTCAPRYAPVEYEQVCTSCNPCNPCSRGWSLLNPFSW